MIKQITKYVARDGSEWHDEAKATARDKLCAYVERTMAPLGRDQKIRNYDYVQHVPKIVIDCRVGILRLCAIEFPQYDLFRHEPPEEVHPFSIVGRILDDMGGPLSDAWRRFMRIDDKGREWEQSFYVYVKYTPGNAVERARV